MRVLSRRQRHHYHEAGVRIGEDRPADGGIRRHRVDVHQSVVALVTDLCDLRLLVMVLRWGPSLGHIKKQTWLRARGVDRVEQYRPCAFGSCAASSSSDD